MAEKRPPDSSRRSERSRRAIHDAALALVGEAGYRATTIEAIAARAGVGKQTIYRWWPSKAAVLLEAFVALSDRTARRSAEAAGGAGDAGGFRGGPDAGEPGDGAGGGPADAPGIPDTGDLAADLKTVLRATVDELTDPVFEAPARALAAEGIIDPALGAAFVRQLLEPGLQLYADRLRAAQRAGWVRADADPRIALELLVGPVTHRWLLRTLPLTHAYADAVVDHVLRGLEAPRGGPAEP
ncbi:TetR/AcrR family transcriptional regulator [Streptomyces sp. PTD5-9]|uniref:TetR/AcrR family transcriptional regulator n=1 Tax=Streptomyces sp. PTD5-9 TaxID=3120150 RepID=UPI003008A0F7